VDCHAVPPATMPLTIDATLTDLQLPLKSPSAPPSLMPSRVGSPRAQPPTRRAFSRPTSPRHSLKHSRSVGLLTRPGSAATLRPGSASATFGKAPRKPLHAAALCSVHSYADLSSTLKASGATAFSAQPRLVPHVPLCSVHSYADLRSTLKLGGAVPFGHAPRKLASDRPATPSHYIEPTSTLREGAGTFGRAAARIEASTNASAPVHSYQLKTTTFTSRTGTFPTAGRESHERPPLCRIHSFGELRSTLKTSGVASWGPKPASKPTSTPTPPKMKGSTLKMIAALKEQQVPPRPPSPSEVEDTLAAAHDATIEVA